MICPLTLNNPACDVVEECREACAWRVEVQSAIDGSITYTCAVSALALASVSDSMKLGTLPLISGVNIQGE